MKRREQRGGSTARARRVFIAANGPGPWPCVGCEILIERLGGRKNEGHLHHVDEDITNDVATNLWIMHPKCHQQLHQGGKPHAPEHNAKVGRPGRVLSPEWRAKLSAAGKGRVITPEWREHLSQSTKGRPKSPETRARMAAGQRLRRERERGANDVSRG